MSAEGYWEEGRVHEGVAHEEELRDPSGVERHQCVGKSRGWRARVMREGFVSPGKT